MERTLADEGFALGDLLVCLYHSQLMPLRTAKSEFCTTKESPTYDGEDPSQPFHPITPDG